MMRITLDESTIQPGTYRVVLHTGTGADFEAFLRFAQESSTISRTDALAVVNLLAEWIAQRGGQGQEVNLGPLGRSRLGMKGQFDKLPERILDKEVELTISWSLPRKLKAGVAKAGAKLVRERVLPRPKAPAVLEVRRILAGAKLDDVPAQYVAGQAIQVYGQRLNYDPANNDEGVFLIDEQQTTERLENVVTIGPSKLIVLMPAAATGTYTLKVRRRHPRSTGNLLTGRYDEPLVPVT